MGYSNVTGDLNVQSTITSQNVYVFGSTNLNTLTTNDGVTVNGSLSVPGNSTFGKITTANLTVTGNFTVTTTNTAFSNALSVNNAGTATALKVVQFEPTIHTHNVAEFWDFQTLAMVIDPEGNVGIHTTNTGTFGLSVVDGANVDSLQALTVSTATLSTPLANVTTLNVSTLANINILNVSSEFTTTLERVDQSYVTQSNEVSANIITANITSANIATGNVAILNVSTGANVTYLTVSSQSNLVASNIQTLNVASANIVTENVANINVSTGANVTYLSVSSQSNSVASNILTANITTLNVFISNTITGNVSTLTSIAANVTTLDAFQSNTLTGNVSTLGVLTLNVTSANVLTDNVTTLNAFTSNTLTGNVSTLGVLTLNVTSANVLTDNVTTLNAFTSNTVTANVSTLGVLTQNVTTLNVITSNTVTANVSTLAALAANVTTLNVITSNTVTANVSTLAALAANLSTLNVITSNTVTANVSTLGVLNQNVSTLNVITSNTVTGNVSTLGVLNQNVSTLNVITSNTVTGNVSTFSALDANVSTLNAFQSNTLTGNVSTLGVLGANVTTLNVITSNTVTGNVSTLGVLTQNVSTLNVITSNTVTGNVSSFSSLTSNIDSLNVGSSANITNMTVTNFMNVATANIGNIVISSTVSSTANSLTANSVTIVATNNVYAANAVQTTNVSAVSLYGAIVGSNTISATVVTASSNVNAPTMNATTANSATVVATTGFYGPVVGSNVIGATVVTASSNVNAPTMNATTANAETVVATTGFYGPIVGSNVIGATVITASSNVNAPTMNSTTANAATVVATTAFYGPIAGSNVIGATVITASSNVNAPTINATTSNSATVVATTGFYGPIVGSNVIGATVITASSNVNAPTMNATTANAATVVATTGFYGPIVGSNTVASTVVTASSNVNAPTINAVTANSATVVATTGFYGPVVGSNVIGATVITASSNVNAPTMNASTISNAAAFITTNNVYAANAIQTTNIVSTSLTSNSTNTNVTSTLNISSLLVGGSTAGLNQTLITTGSGAGVQWGTIVGSQWTTGTGNIYYISNVGIGTSAVSANLSVTGNIYASNAIQTTNIISAGFTSNATNVNFNFDTISIPYLNVSSVSNIASLVLQSALATNYGGTGADGSAVTANKVLASPNGSTGGVTYRALVGADLPTVSFSPGAAGTYGSSTAIPTIVVDTYGRITGISTSAISSLSGLTTYGVLYATSSTAATTTAVGSSGQPLLSSGAGVAPAYGTLGLSYGGTGQTTKAAAFDALSPMTTLGDIIYGGASGANSRLAGNTTATKNFLVQTGNGTVSGAPSWGTIAAGDVPTLNQNTTGSAGSLSTTFTSGYVLYGQDTGVPAYASGHFWDNANGRLGIGNSTPQARIWLPSTSTSTGLGIYNADVAMILGNTAGSTNSNTGSIQVKAGGSATGIGTSNYNLTLNPDGGNVGVGVPTGTAFQSLFYVRSSTVTGAVSVPTGTVMTIDKSDGGILSFRQSSDNGTYSGISFLDNNIGGFMLFRNYTGASSQYGDALHISGYNGVFIYGQTTSSVDPSQQTIIMSCTYKQNGTSGITSTAAVGIGTTNPGYKLDVYGGLLHINDRGNGMAIFQSDAPWDHLHLWVDGATSYIDAGGAETGLQFRVLSGGSVYPASSYTTVCTMTGGGNVGIGTTSARTSPRLWSANDVTLTTGNYAGDVACQIAAVGLTNPDKRLALMYDTTNNIGLVQAMVYGTGTSPLCLNAAGGNVGIGTTSPAFRHHVYNGDSSFSYYGPNATWGAYLLIGAGTNNRTSGRAQIISTNGNLHMDSGTGQIMYLNYYANGDGVGAECRQYGALNVTGDVTAFYSDERLKTKVGSIENPLDKVCSLTAFKYVHNDIAKSVGFEGDGIQVGLSAQEVQKILPEVVARAPFDEGTVYDVGVGKSKSGQDYLTLKYERLVPLLVEAVKEERAERLKVEERLARLEKLLLKE